MRKWFIYITETRFRLDKNAAVLRILGGLRLQNSSAGVFIQFPLIYINHFHISRFCSLAQVSVYDFILFAG